MLLDLPLVLETRRNHALEHATLHVHARTHQISMAGHSNPTGFFLLGDLQLEDIATAANEALTRLRAAESRLAVHECCGTNMATTAALSATLVCATLRRVQSIRSRR